MLKTGSFKIPVAPASWHWVGLLGALILGSASTVLAQPAEVSSCIGCHGADGVSYHPTVPTIAGMSRAYLAEQLEAFQSHERPCVEADFAQVAIPGDHCMTLADVDVVADYFAGLTYQPAKQSFDSEKAADGRAIHESICAICHRAEGTNPEDDAGILAGQWKPYLIRSLMDFRAGERLQSVPKRRAMNRLSDIDIRALAEYYASVTLPKDAPKKGTE